MPQSPSGSTSGSALFYLRHSELNNAQIDALNKHLEDFSLYRLEECLEQCQWISLAFLFAKKHCQHPDGLPRLTEWLSRSSLTRIPTWAQVILAALPKTIWETPTAFSKDHINKLTTAFELCVKNSDDQTLLNWIENNFKHLYANSTKSHLDSLYSSRDNDPDYASASNTSLKIIDIIKKRLQINPKFWQNALFDFSAFAQDPKRHLLSWIPHTWSTTIFSTLAAAEKRDATATFFALWTGSKDELRRRTANLLCTFIQDEAISSQPLTTEMVNTYQASLKTLLKNVGRNPWPLSRENLNRALAISTSPEGLKKSMFAQVENNLSNHFTDRPERSLLRLRLNRSNPQDDLLNEISNHPNRIPRVAFTGEGDVVDVGGPLDEAIMITYDKLFSDDTLWTKRPDGFFEPKATSTAAGAKRWAQFGGLLGLTILRSNALGPQFNQSFFVRLHAALHYHTYLNDAEYLPNTPTIKAVSVMWGLQSAIKTPNDLLGDLMQDDECSAQQKALFSWLCEPNESTRARLATSIGCQDKAVLASDQNMQEYLDILRMPTTSEEALTDALGAVLPIAKGLAKFCPDLAGRCLATGPSTVQMVMNGPTLPLRETLLLAIDAGHRETLHETTPSALRSERDRAHKLLRSFIEDQRVSEALLEKFLVFVTGQKTLGHNGTIKAIPDDFPVVRSHSCFASIDIPKIFLNPSANSEQLKTEFLKHLTAVLENHDGTFDINEQPPGLARFEAIAAEFMDMLNRAR